jgi:hypothetical protein
LLGTPQLKKVRLIEIHLRKLEVDQLVELVRQKSILQNVQYLQWSNSYSIQLLDWWAEEEHFEELFDNILVFFPQIKLNR